MHLFTCSNKKHSDKKGGLSAFGECVLVFSFAFLVIFFAFCSFVFAEPVKVYLSNLQANGFRLRPSDGVIQTHTGDSISYVEVSAGVTYYSDRNLAYYSASLPKGNQPISLVVFPFTPSADGVIVVDDLVDGTLTDLQIYYFSEDPGTDDPDDPGTDDPDDPGTDDPDDPGTDDPDDPVDPGPDVPSFDNSYFDKIIDLLYVLIFLEFVNFVFPLSRSWIKSLIGGKND